VHKRKHKKEETQGCGQTAPRQAAPVEANSYSDFCTPANATADDLIVDCTHSDPKRLDCLSCAHSGTAVATNSAKHLATTLAK